MILLPQHPEYGIMGKRPRTWPMSLFAVMFPSTMSNLVWEFEPLHNGRPFPSMHKAPVTSPAPPNPKQNKKGKRRDSFFLHRSHLPHPLRVLPHNPRRPTTALSDLRPNWAWHRVPGRVVITAWAPCGRCSAKEESD